MKSVCVCVCVRARTHTHTHTQMVMVEYWTWISDLKQLLLYLVYVLWIWGSLLEEAGNGPTKCANSVWKQSGQSFIAFRNFGIIDIFLLCLWYSSVHVLSLKLLWMRCSILEQLQFLLVGAKEFTILRILSVNGYVKCLRTYAIKTYSTVSIALPGPLQTDNEGFCCCCCCCFYDFDSFELRIFVTTTDKTDCFTPCAWFVELTSRSDGSLTSVKRG